MPFHKSFAVCAICLTTFALAGCSGEPSESDIEDAVKADVAQVNTTVKNVGGGLSMQTQVHGVKKIACAKASEDAGYNCDVELDITAPFIGRSKNIGKIRLVEGDSGWAVTE